MGNLLLSANLNVDGEQFPDAQMDRIDSVAETRSNVRLDLREAIFFTACIAACFAVFRMHSPTGVILVFVSCAAFAGLLLRPLHDADVTPPIPFRLAFAIGLFCFHVYLGHVVEPYPFFLPDNVARFIRQLPLCVLVPTLTISALRCNTCTKTGRQVACILLILSTVTISLYANKHWDVIILAHEHWSEPIH